MDCREMSQWRLYFLFVTRSKKIPENTRETATIMVTEIFSILPILDNDREKITINQDIFYFSETRRNMIKSAHDNSGNLLGIISINSKSAYFFK